MTTSTEPQNSTSLARTDCLPLVRGLLADALRRCPPTSDAALELCAAWEHLDEPGGLPDVVDPAVTDTVPTVTVLVSARQMLCAGIITIEPARRALALAAAARHITTALADLSRDGAGAPTVP